MINEFLEIIGTEDYYDTGFLNFVSIKIDENNGNLEIIIMIQFSILSVPGVEMTQYWQIDCSQVQKCIISPNTQIYAHEIMLSDKHCLLWNYIQSEKSLLVGTVEALSSVEIETLAGCLFLKHQSLVDRWIPFEVSIEVLGRGNDILATGPEEVINAYQQVLEKAGVQCSSYISANPRWYDREKGWIEEPQNLKALIIGESYVVASEINAVKISEDAFSF
jgi:hypothetical protein